jgi:hypothetical protein
MRIANKFVALLLLPGLLLASPALAQQARVVDAATMSQALAGHADAEAAQHDQVRRVLDRTEVREMAARMGLDIADARTAVSTLSGPELGTLAQQATAVEAQALAGGATTVVISLTTLLLILIIVILIAK